MAKAPAPATQGEVPITISTLSGLDGVKDEVYVKIFLNNLAPIYTFSKNEIISKLESNESENTLTELRLQLLPTIREMFSEYAYKTPIDRRSKSMICKDIFILGLCIVEKSVHKDLESMYKY